MSFQILPATLRDAEVIGNLATSVSTSPRITLEFKDCTREAFLDWNIKAVEAEIRACDESLGKAEALKVVEMESGEVVGWAVWGWGLEASTSVHHTKFSVPLPSGCKTSLRIPFLAALNKMETEHRPKPLFYELLELATSPNFQRRGIGSQLISYGLDKANRDKVKVFLSASPGGYPVYKKIGFEEVGRLEIGLDEWGVGVTHVHIAMVKEPEVEE